MENWRLFLLLVLTIAGATTAATTAGATTAAMTAGATTAATTAGATTAATKAGVTTVATTVGASTAATTAGASTAATTAGASTVATTAGAATAATKAGATTVGVTTAGPVDVTTAGVTTASPVDVTTSPDNTMTAGGGATTADPTATPIGVSCFSCTGFSKESECNKEQASTNSGKVQCQIDEACKIVSTELAGNYTVTRGCIEKCVSSHKERSCQTTTEKGTECNKCCTTENCNFKTFSAANRSFGSCVVLLVGVLLAALAAL